MKTQFLVLGATGGIGFAVVKALLDNDICTTILVRDGEKAANLFGVNPNLNYITGVAENTELLNELAKGKTHIFHGLNAPYEKWESVMPSITKKVIEAAEQSGAQLIFPGNNYNYGSIKQPITEITPFHPTSPLGKVRVALENQMKDAARLGRIKVLVVRLSEIWGPNVCNKSFEPIFTGVLRGRAMPWLYNNETAQQMAYNMDAGRVIVTLALRATDQAHRVVNYGGDLHVSIAGFCQELAKTEQKPLKTSVLNASTINFMSIFNPGLKQIKTLRYKYEETIILDDSLFESIVPGFEATPGQQAMRETLAWFQQHKVVPESKQRVQKRKAALLDFVADNLSIGLFPMLIGLLASSVPALQSMAVLFGVVAGIYWSPLTRKLFRGVFRIKRAATVIILAMALGISGQNLSAQATDKSKSHFDGFYGKVDTGKQNVFSGALIDGVDVLTSEARMAITLGLGFRKALINKHFIIGTEFQIGLLDGSLQRSYHNGEQELAITYDVGPQTALGLTLGTFLSKSGHSLIYAYGYSTKRSSDIEFKEENGAVHNQTDKNTFLRYGLGFETRLTNKLYFNSSIGKVAVDFGEALTTDPVTDIIEGSVGFIFKL